DLGPDPVLAGPALGVQVDRRAGVDPAALLHGQVVLAAAAVEADRDLPAAGHVADVDLGDVVAVVERGRQADLAAADGAEVDRQLVVVRAAADGDAEGRVDAAAEVEADALVAGLQAEVEVKRLADPADRGHVHAVGVGPGGDDHVVDVGR